MLSISWKQPVIQVIMGGTENSEASVVGYAAIFGGHFLKKNFFYPMVLLVLQPGLSQWKHWGQAPKGVILHIKEIILSKI